MSSVKIDQKALCSLSKANSFRSTATSQECPSDKVSLTRKMMDTIKLGVRSGMEFEEGMFDIIKSLMYMDGMVLRANPDAILLEDMRPFIQDFRKHNRMKKKIVIVGAGPGGLTSAMILARRGFDVEVLEKDAGRGWQKRAASLLMGSILIPARHF